MRYLLLVGVLLSMDVFAVDINQLMAQPGSPSGGSAFPPPGPYSTKQQFLAAVVSGDVERLLQRIDFGDEEKQISNSVLNVLKNDYGLVMIGDKKAFWRDDCLRMSQTAVPHELAEFSAYRLDKTQSQALAKFQSIQKNLEQSCTQGYGPQAIGAIKSFLQDYSDAFDGYIVQLAQQREAERKAATAAAAQREVENARDASQRAAEQTKQQAEGAALAAEKAARKNKLDACLVSNDYKLLQAAQSVETGEAMISAGNEALEHDDEVAKTSGVTNLGVRRDAGERIVAGKGLVESSFSDYRSLGGTASDPSDVHPGADPCEQYR